MPRYLTEAGAQGLRVVLLWSWCGWLAQEEEREGATRRRGGRVAHS